MRLKFKSEYWISIILGVLVIVLDFYFLFKPMSRWFKPLLLVGFLIGFLHFFIDFLREGKRQKEIELKFLEFVRTLVETVKSGIPLPQAIYRIASSDFGALTPYVKKLSNRTEWGIPAREALVMFANDTGNYVIKRSVEVVVVAERSGGNIEDVLESVTDSVLQVKRLKDERKESVYTQVIQGYIVYFVFLFIMLMLQLKFLPMLIEMAGTLSGIGNVFSSGVVNVEKIQDFSYIFLALILIQGFFAGLIIGKFSEGDVKQGIKHSVILMTIAYLILSIFGGF